MASGASDVHHETGVYSTDQNRLLQAVGVSKESDYPGSRSLSIDFHNLNELNET